MELGHSDSLPAGVNDCYVSVVIPVYGDGAALSELTERIVRVAENSAWKKWEVILVNDGSPQKCWGLIQRLAECNPKIRAINLQRNFGQHNALLAGIKASAGDVVLTMDDDLQHPPEEIPKLISKLQTGFDLVYGAPIAMVHSSWRNWTSIIGKAALKSVLGAQSARQISAFRVFRGGLRPVFLEYRSPYVSIDVLLSWATTRIGSVPVRHEPTKVEYSRYTLWRLGRHLTDMVIGFSIWPLRLASFVGFAFTCFGAILLIYVIVRYFTSGGSVPGFPFLASIIVIFSGAQLFALGMIGEYLARMYFRLMDRPPYLIENAINFPCDRVVA
ncbi:MAG TPA: glycosyltransferase family 2 protein [Acidobacteriota bacterium]|jgi:undecaprenyl-phosphate 4-deoxy-4-formamido-L-arabinose transferase